MEALVRVPDGHRCATKLCRQSRRRLRVSHPPQARARPGIDWHDARGHRGEPRALVDPRLAACVHRQVRSNARALLIGQALSVSPRSSRRGAGRKGTPSPFRGASFRGNASVICCAIHSAVGWAVTLIQTRSRRVLNWTRPRCLSAAFGLRGALQGLTGLLVMARASAIACGYADAIDLDRLRNARVNAVGLTAGWKLCAKMRLLTCPVRREENRQSDPEMPRVEGHLSPHRSSPSPQRHQRHTR